MELENIDDEWNNFISNNYNFDDENITENEEKEEYEKLVLKNETLEIPKPSELYVSTKSKIAYLSQPIDLDIFWKIPVIPYISPVNGVVKKQIKINSKTPAELELLNKKLEKELYYEEYVISHIDNPNGRVKFKDIRKLTIGISKKDIMLYRSKQKQAFYNCFVTIIRLKIDGKFNEYHVKMFNTGKTELPGVRNDIIYNALLQYLLNMLQPYFDVPLTFNETSDTILINSNFNCGFYIIREALFDILKQKYNIQAIYDPCSYPGIQCKFYYNLNSGVQTGIASDNKDHIIEVSFMIFRTGSVLIVGMCDEYVLQDIYKYITAIFNTEFKYICQSIIPEHELIARKKKKLPRRKILHITVDKIEEPIIVADNKNVVTDADTDINTETIKPKKRGKKNKHNI